MTSAVCYWRFTRQTRFIIDGAHLQANSYERMYQVGKAAVKVLIPYIKILKVLDLFVHRML